MRRPIVSLISTLSLAKLSSAKLNVFSQPRIIGGENAEPNRYPYMVSLLKPSGVHTCGGVLVAKDVVLTAAHCSGTSEGKPLSTAHVGRWNTLKYGSNDEYDSIRIKKEYIHPRYNEDDNLTYDLMLVQLSKNSIYEPVRLNERFSIPNANSLLTAIGFGLTVVGDDLSSSSVLQQVDLNYIPNTVCEKSNDGNDSYEGLINNAMICAGAPGKDGCLGDSGGPLISRKDNSNAKDDVIVGVTSWGYSCADPNFPGVWASVFDQIDWLTGMICQISTSPPRQFYDCPQKGIDGDVPVVVEITLDDYPMESSWQVTCNNGLVYGEAVIGKYGFKKNEVLQEVVYLPSGSTCVFTIKDKYGDGLCCDTAGSYKVFLSNKPSSTLVSGGGNFGSEKSDSFSIPTDAYDDDGDGEVVIAKGQVPLTVAIQLDEYPKEIGWRVDRVGIALETVYSVPQGTYRTPNELVVENLALEKRQIYTFHVTDSEGDGMNRGYVQVLLGTQIADTSDIENTILFLGGPKLGQQMTDSFDITFISEINGDSTVTSPPEDDEPYITLELRLDVYPEEVGVQLRTRDLVSISRSSPAEDGEIVFFRNQGYYADKKDETVYETIALPKLDLGAQREFIFIVTDGYGDGLCCDYLSGGVIPGYSIYDGNSSNGNLILTSKMKEKDREVKYFTLPSEQLVPVPSPSIAPTVLQTISADIMNVQVTLSYSGGYAEGESRFYIDEIMTGDRMASHPCTSNANTIRRYTLPSGMYTFALESCSKGGTLQGTLKYEVKMIGVNPNRPPLLEGSSYGSESFMIVGNDVPTIPMSIEFTTGDDPASLTYYVKRLDVIETDSYLTQVAKFSLSPNQLYIHSLSVQNGGLYRIAFEDVTAGCLEGNELKLNIGKQSYPIKFPGDDLTENRHVKFLAGSLPTIQSDAPFLTLRVKFDQDPLEFEYVLLESDSEAVTLHNSQDSRKMPDHRIYAFGPMNETLVSTMPMKERVEILRLPTYSGDKQFTILFTDSGGDGLCCKQGEGGPVELFDGPISDNNIIFQDPFQGSSRISYSFARNGEKLSSSSATPLKILIAACSTLFVAFLVDS